MIACKGSQLIIVFDVTKRDSANGFDQRAYSPRSVCTGKTVDIDRLVVVNVVCDPLYDRGIKVCLLVILEVYADLIRPDRE